MRTLLFLSFAPKSEAMVCACAVLDGILAHHITMAGLLITEDTAIVYQLEQDLRDDCDQVMRYLQAVNTLGEISARICNLVVGAGKLLSCRIVVAALIYHVCVRFLDKFVQSLIYVKGHNAHLLHLDDIYLHDLSSGSEAIQFNRAFTNCLVAHIRERINNLVTESMTNTGRPVFVASLVSYRVA